MAQRRRDFRNEYLRRIAKGEARGLSRSQARGHAKPAEKAVRQKTPTLADERVQVALAALRTEKSIARAAKAAKIAPERLRKFAVDRDIIEKVRGRWRTTATMPRQMLIISRGRAFDAKLPAFETASKAGRYLNAVKQFLRTNRVAFLKPFEGQGVSDAAGKYHPFETEPNTLYRLAAGGEASFEQIYRIVI